MKFKQGDTFDYTGPVSLTDAAGDAVDLTNWTVNSSVRFPDAGRIEPLTATWLNGFTNIRLRHDDTDDWPPGPMDIDVQFTSPSEDIVSTETVRFTVVSDLTHA